MGANLRVEERPARGEPVADVTIGSARLNGVTVPATRAPAMIDEYPILAVAAACANGVTRLEGLAELRVKESDRLAAIAEGLAACGIRVETGADWLAIEGTGGSRPPGGGQVAVRYDHRIAMAFLVMGAACRDPVAVDDGTAIATSFPNFVALMNGIGAQMRAGGNG
jgi:3-phosphoshikimate 1-carboxyvinyltransferase